VRVSRRSFPRQQKGKKRNRSRAFQLIERLESRQLLAAVTGSGTGLIANYFTDSELKNLGLTRVDPSVDFTWGQDSPDASMIPADGFSARWVGKVQAQFSESYTFYTNSDEGVALWVNGQQIIDNFTDHTLTEDSGTITLNAGETYTIRLDYYDNAFDAQMQLSWSSDSTPKQIIPTSQLYPDSGWTGGAWLNKDIGSPNQAGSVSSTGKSTYTVIGGGNGIGNGVQGGSDQFQYLYQTLDGDGSLIAKVDGQDDLGQNGLTGIMIRDDLGAGSTFASLTTSTDGTPLFEARDSANGGVSNTSIGANGDYWLKLVRDGDFVRGYASDSGNDGTWTYVGSQNIPMDQTAYAGVFSTSGGTGLVNKAVFTNITVNPVVPLGAGLDAVRDYSFGSVFVDIAKQMRTFQGPNLGPLVGVDTNGWATSDFMTIFISGFVNQAHLYNGIYKGSFTGQADLNTWQTPGGQILNKSYDPNTNTTTFDYRINASEGQDGWYAGINFTNTRRDPFGPTNTGITNLKLIRPGYDPNTTQVFTDAYLQHLSQFSVLRFMDWTQTNNSTVVNWSDRVTPDYARQSSTTGVAWEYVIQLANLTHKDIWVNVPAKANDDYIANLAALLKNSLDPDRVVYVEYSNEVWNGIFTQNSDNFNAAVAEVNAGNSPLNADGETNQTYWAWRRTAKRLKQISDIFAQVWGQNEINARVRPVLASQYANPLVLQQGIEFIERTYGSPSKYIYGVASAPYFGFDALDNSNTNLTVDQIIAAMQSSVNNQKYFNFGTYAARYGLQNMTYEGGPETFGPNNVAAKKAASLDPRMKAVVTSYLNNWYNAGGGLFNWFVTGPTNWNSSNGTWGLTDQIDNLNAPKIQGTTEVATSPRQPLKYGIAIPAQFDARAIAGATLPYSTTYQKNPAKGSSIDYFVRAPAAGKYQIVFTAATAGTNEQIRVAVNNSAVRTITLANTGSSTGNFTDNIVGTFTLNEGENLVHLTAVNVTSWNIQTVTVAPAPSGNGTPFVVSPADASPLSVNGKTTNVSVFGGDDNGEGNLTYSWEAVNEQPTSVTFSANGTNAAKNSVATFTRPGTYELRVTISDGTASTTSTVFVTVNQIVTSITVAPSGVPIANGETKQLTATAKDQFGVQFYNPPSFSWQVDNSFGTVTQSGVYQAPASGLGTATVRATIGAISGTATIITQSTRAADNPANALPGIDYVYVEGSYTVVPNFDTLTPVKSGTLSNVSLSPAQRTTNYAIQYTGYVYIPTAGTWTFYTASDDGSKLSIGGSQIVNNDGAHSLTEKSGSILLDQGWHAFKLGYFQGGGGAALTMSYSGPGFAKQAVPSANLERADVAPTVATPPAANPNPVSSTSTNLTVVGSHPSGESTLTYTWSATSIPSGAANPIFSINGSNDAKFTTATFNKAGTYTLQVSISDGTRATTASLQVTVNSTVTSIAVSPANPDVRQNRTQQFAAIVKDQFGNTVANPPTITWGAPPNGGTIDSNGLYTAPDDVGGYTVTAQINGASGMAIANVIIDNAPQILNAANASPNPTTGSSTSLSVLGVDDGGEANLTYTWSATNVPFGANAPNFSANGTNAAKNTTAIFSSSGTYTLTVVISDGFKTTFSSVDVQVMSGGSSAPIVVTPAAANPSPVTGTTTGLSVLGGNPNGEQNLTYTWATTGTPPASVSFSSNGSNASKNTTAMFSKAGGYTFEVTISNGQQSTTSSVTVQVNQTLTSIALSPSSASVQQNATQTFTPTARDQFGQMISNPGTYTWSVSSTGTGGTITTAGLYTAPASGTPTDVVHAKIGATDGTATVTVTTQPSQGLGIFTADGDIGAPAIAGSASLSGTVYTVKASGADIYGNSDQFHYVYKQLNGDGQIIARVTAVQNTNLRAKAGIMFRDSLAANAKFADIVIAPDRTTSFQFRTTTGQGVSGANAANSPAPYWLKLVRVGNTITGYNSPDGTNWTQVGTTTFTLATNAYVGLALTSHDNTQLNTSTFDNVSVTAGTTPTNNAPQVVNPASASPNPVTGTSTNLSVLGSDDGGEAGLTYTWSATALPAGATAPTFGANGTNAAKNTTAVFIQSGTYTLTVVISDGVKTTSSSVDVKLLSGGSSAPIVITPAGASAAPVTGKSTGLSVMGGNQNGEQSLTYTWSTTGTPPASVSFSANGTNAAKNTTATFTRAGTYNFQVLISNGTQSTTSTVTVVVSQTLTSLSLSPAGSMQVKQGTAQQFTPIARDQFGQTNANPGTITWSISSSGEGGTITGSGLYTAPTTGTPTDVVHARLGTFDATATVTVTTSGPTQTGIFTGGGDIGSPSIGGSDSLSGSTYTLKASGADIYGTSDQFHYVYKQLTGDGQIIARVIGMQNTNARAKAGIMMRDSLAANARFADIVITPDKTTGFQYRTTTGQGTAGASATNTAAPYWVKLVRVGNTITGFNSPDGANWSQVGIITLSLSSTYYVGLALTSHDNTQLNTATFDNVSVTAGSAGAPLALTGTVFGAAAANSSVSAEKLFDGNMATYYQSASPGQASWAGLDLGTQRTITEITFAPRSGFASQMVWGNFEASNTPDFSSGVVNLHTIKTTPSSSGTTTVSISVAGKYRYVRYVAPANSFGNIAEMKVYGV
jgi:hypothetical protein